MKVTQMKNSNSRVPRSAIIAVLLISIVLTVTGCGGSGGISGKSVTPLPRIRIGRYASPSVGTVYLNPDNIGQHAFSGGSGGKKGIVYTCRAGHVDLAHARKSADWAAYLYRNFTDKFRKKETKFSFSFREPAKYYVELTYPANWDSMTQAEKDKIIKDAAATLAQYSAYTGTMFHEMLTWFGYSSIGIWSEFPSAFAWEDTFSDLFGTHLAGIAFRDPKRDYNTAMTMALDNELKMLGAQPKKVASRVSKSLHGQWYSGDFAWMKMKARNFDTGFDDGFITPWLTPNISECPGAKPQSYPAPKLDDIRKYGFKIKFELAPSAKKGKVLKIVWPDKKQRQKRIVPDRDFVKLMDYILKDAAKRGIRATPEFVH